MRRERRLKMKYEKMVELFRLWDDDYDLDFNDVQGKHSKRADVHILVTLDKILPDDGGQDLISCHVNDMLYLNVEPEELAPLITEEQLKDLVRAGLGYDDVTDSVFIVI